jgi:uncharacterized protein DUF6599
LRVLSLLSLLIVLLLGCIDVATAKVSPEEVAKALPREIAGFRLVGTVRQRIENDDREGEPEVAGAASFASGSAEYVSSEGEKLSVSLIRFERDSDAYSYLTRIAQRARNSNQATDIKLTRDIGTSSFTLPGRVIFFKGTSFVIISSAGSDSANASKLAKSLAISLPKGEDDVPILVKHLPQWEQAQATVLYRAGFDTLAGIVPDQRVLEAITSEGDADAVLASYGNAQFLLIEFNTPQLASDNDRAITAKLAELRQQGQPVPTSYKKVGNYSVFVFNAASEAEAKNLIDQVEYAQMVTWLGNNPYLLEKAQRDYYETTAGVLVSVVKASGLSLLACLTLGGLMGALLFGRRRAQQRAAEAYSDAGGMLRLNLDEITPQHDPAKLLGPGN